MTETEAASRQEGNGLRLTGWAALALIVALVRDRLWATPNLAFFTLISRRLGTNPFPKGLAGDYLLTNMTGPVLARILGQTSPQGYVRLHFVVLIVGLAGVVFAAFRRFGYRVARTLVWVLAASPAVTVCFEWLGQPDVFTLCLALGIAICRRRAVAFGLAVVLGVTHAEQGALIALAALAAHHILDDRADGEAPWRPLAWWAAAGLGGVAVGRAIVEAYLRIDHVVIHNPRTSYLKLGLSGFWHEHTLAPVALLYSLWGPLWLALGWLAWRWWRSGHRFGPVPLIATVAVAALVPIAVTIDETRVYSMITAPLLLVIAVLVTKPELVAESAPALSPMQPVRAVWAMPVAVVVAVVALAAVPGEFNAGSSCWATSLPPAHFARFLRNGTVPGGPNQLSPWLLDACHFVIPAVH